MKSVFRLQLSVEFFFYSFDMSHILIWICMYELVVSVSYTYKIRHVDDTYTLTASNYTLI